MTKKINLLTNGIAFLMVWSLLNYHFDGGILVFIILSLPLLILGGIHGYYHGLSRLEKQYCKGAFVFLVVYLFVSILSMDLTNIKKALDFVALALPLPIFLGLRTFCSIKEGILYGLISYIILGSLYSGYAYIVDGLSRAVGLTYNPITWVSIIMLSLPIMLFCEQEAKEKSRKLLYGFIVILCLLNLYFAYTRAMYIAVILALAILLLIKHFHWYYILAGIIILAGCFYFKDIFIKLASRGYDMDRWHAYMASIDMFCRHPLLGIGAGHWKDIYAAQYWPSFHGEALPHAHNIFLSFLSKSGLVGFSGFLYFLYFYFQYFWLQIKANKLYGWVGFIGFLVFVLHGLLDSLLDVRFPERTFWMFMSFYYIYFMSEYNANVENQD